MSPPHDSRRTPASALCGHTAPQAQTQAKRRDYDTHFAKIETPIRGGGGMQSLRRALRERSTSNTDDRCTDGTDREAPPVLRSIILGGYSRRCLVSLSRRRARRGHRIQAETKVMGVCAVTAGGIGIESASFHAPSRRLDVVRAPVAGGSLELPLCRRDDPPPGKEPLRSQRSRSGNAARPGDPHRSKARYARDRSLSFCFA